MKKRLLSLFLSTILIVMCVPFTTFASGSSDGYLNTDIYNYISNDYLLLTKMKKSEADNLFSRLNAAGYDYEDIEIIEKIIGSQKNASYEDNVLYIQDNYDNITNNISSKEKEVLDKYFLNYAIKYYVDHGNSNDFKSTQQATTFSEPIEPILIDAETFEVDFPPDEHVLQQDGVETSSTSVASLRIFADKTSSTLGSSGLGIDVGTHAWLTVTNISNKDITVGKFIIKPGKTMALGTWGNKSEHKGLWYNLESYYVSKYDAYDNRVSLRVDLDQSWLDDLNTHMVGYDKWSVTNNCSSFAVSSWNLVCSDQLSAGVINTPKNLAGSIAKNSNHYENFPVPYDYVVYYANGSKTPVQSEIFK